MAGMFELFLDDDAAFRFQLTAPDGTVMAVSRAFSDKEEAVKGIAAVREYAGMGLVREISASPMDRLSPPRSSPPRQAAPRPTAVNEGVPVAGLRRTALSRTEALRACRTADQARPLVSAADGYSPGV